MADKRELDPRILELFDGYVHGQLSRRQFLEKAARVTTSTVSAAAVLAALSPDYTLAQQVDPDNPEIRASYKRYASPNGAGVMQGYFARPAVTAHKLPAIVVVHENRGLNPYIEDVTRRLALEGFIAFAPDALTPLGGYPGNDDDGRELQRQRDRDEMVEDFVAAVGFLKDHPDSTGKVGAVGFCFGGGVVMTLAIRIPDLAAAVPYYGRHPVGEDVGAIAAPMLFHHAELDKRVNQTWPEFEKALLAAGIEFENHFYEDANHGFHNDTTPRYDESAAQLSWQRTVRFFRKHLKE
ncbi:MAG: dienelactone hydrolase family protein [Woeseiaceae bacterium]|nr:dienelactone hydrolase family protein [Woeseiaceae bacterium]